MTMKLRIKLTPPESYFLGGERIFDIGDGNKHYFIRSLKTPPQTTLFGILRYLGIPEPSPEMHFDAENIGAESFHLFKRRCETSPFGGIRNISPLYLMDKNERYYIRTPFDHKAGEYKEDGLDYLPFNNYVQDALETTKRFPKDYDAKQGIADSWLCVTPGEQYKKTCKNLFGSDIRTGIDKVHTKKAFVKKEYVRLKEGFSFVFFAEVTEAFKYAGERFVQPGFAARVENVEKVVDGENSGEPTMPPDLLSARGRYTQDVICAQSDIYLSVDEARDLYDLCDFVCVQTRGFRGRTTNASAKTVKERFRRYEQTATLIQAGSVFIPKENQKACVVKILTYNCWARIAGFNHIISGGTEV